VADFAAALKGVDADQLAHKQFSPGIGPYGEAEAVRAALSKLRETKPSSYTGAMIRRAPDLLIPGQWEVEFKIVRPFGDNGRLAEHWSENVLPCRNSWFRGFSARSDGPPAYPPA